MSASVVDLPQPVGPTTATNSPAAIVRLRSRSAVNDLPVGATNRFVTPWSSIAGVPLVTDTVRKPCGHPAATYSDSVVAPVLVI